MLRIGVLANSWQRVGRLRWRGRAPWMALALLAGLGAPLAQATLGGHAVHRGQARVPGPELGQPAYADPANQPSPSASAEDDTAAAGLPVHLPLLGPGTGDGGPAPHAGSSLTVPSVGLQVGVVDYTDCSGNTPMTRASAVRFTCAPDAVTDFVGHNPGVFTPLLNTHTGDRVYYQHDGIQEVFVITSSQRVSPQQAAAYSQDGSYRHAVLATCAAPDSSSYWIFLADPLGGPGAPASSPQGQSGGGGQPSQPQHPRPQPQPSPSPSPSPSPQGPIPGVPLPPPPI